MAIANIFPPGTGAVASPARTTQVHESAISTAMVTAGRKTFIPAIFSSPAAMLRGPRGIILEELIHADSHSQPAGRQSRRNRDTRHARRQRTGNPPYRHLFAGGPLLAAPDQGRRGLPGGSWQAAGGRLSRHRGH